MKRFDKNKLKENIFSIKYSQDKKHKIIKFLNFKIKIRQKENTKKLFEEMEKRIEFKICKSFSIYNQHQKVFPKYKNIHNKKEIALIATGPSLKKFVPLDNCIYVGVNQAYKYSQVKFDYLFLQDFSGKTKEYIEEFCNYNVNNTKKFLGFVSEKDIPECIIPDKYSYYDNIERYYTAFPSDKKNFTYDISCEALGDRFSIVFPAMQFILWTNPKKIYLVGCDSNSQGYYDKCLGKNFLLTTEIIDGWKNMKSFIKTYYPDTEVISINPVGLKGIFNDIYQ